MRTPAVSLRLARPCCAAPLAASSAYRHSATGLQVMTCCWLTAVCASFFSPALQLKRRRSTG